MKITTNKCVLATAICAVLLAAGAAPADELPVREVTVFKDGHAFVLHEGTMPVDEDGNVVMDYLPRPIIGTFWLYSRDEGLQSVVAGSKVVTLNMTAITRDELLKANIGKRVRVRENNRNETYDAVILAIPSRGSDELAATSVPGTGPQLPVEGRLLMLRVAEGTKVILQDSITEIAFLDEPEGKVDRQEFRNVMTMKFGRGYHRSEATVGMTYVQRGIRWIPSYRIEIDGKGKARLKLQATIINELRDLRDVKTHLVIGVPSFAFKDTVDPMSMQETVAQLGSVFREDSRTRYAFSNMIMNQSTQYDSAHDSPRPGQGDTIDLGPEMKGAGGNEDLYIFTVDHITLKKGERMVIPITEYELSYRDVYTLDLPFSPPGEMMNNIGSEQQLEMARLMSAPKVKHIIRMKNDGKHPITTAPAMVLSNGNIIAQGMTKYTAIGADCDLELTVAVNISVRRTDTETGRQPNAMSTNGRNFEKVTLAGNINIINRGEKAVEVEVKRSVLGKIASAASDGAINQLGPQDWGAVVGELPGWWRSYGWPGWWYNVNSIGSVKWVVKIDAGKTVDLGYEWHYFWCW